jgi:hypothetical protein
MPDVSALFGSCVGRKTLHGPESVGMIAAVIAIK